MNRCNIINSIQKFDFLKKGFFLLFLSLLARFTILHSSYERDGIAEFTRKV